MYKKIMLLIVAAAFLCCITGCSTQQTDAQMPQTAQTAVVSETEEKQESATAEIKEENGLLSDEQEQLLYNFALCYAETLRDMQPSDFTGLFADEKGEESVLNQTAYTVLTTVRSISGKDLSLENAQVTYNIHSVTDYGNEITVELTEDNVQKFRHLSGESFTCNIYHKFVITETDNGWKVKSHLHEEDFFLMAEEAWDDTWGTDYEKRAEEAVKLIVADAEENFILRTENLNEYTETDVTKEYDREKAVEYAQQWYNKRNPEYLEYDLYGGNCQNFASQCVHAGGMDMDIKGNYTCQWKFYGKDLNLKQVASGRSYSFIGVDEFYTYAIYNSTSGLVTQPDIDLKYAQKGDIIQVGAYGKWRHSLVVSDVLTDENGTQTEIILASNTADRWNYPMSAYIYTYPRLIHIDGQI